MGGGDSEYSTNKKWLVITPTTAEMKSMEIGVGRFGYLTAGTLGSIGGGIGIDLMFGNPWGAVDGAVIGAESWAAEQAYDGYMYWQTQMAIFLNNVENGLKNGWVPGR